MKRQTCITTKEGECKKNDKMLTRNEGGKEKEKEKRKSFLLKTLYFLNQKYQNR